MNSFRPKDEDGQPDGGRGNAKADFWIRSLLHGLPVFTFVRRPLVFEPLSRPVVW